MKDYKIEKHMDLFKQHTCILTAAYQPTYSLRFSPVCANTVSMCISLRLLYSTELVHINIAKVSAAWTSIEMHS